MQRGNEPDKLTGTNNITNNNNNNPRTNAAANNTGAMSDSNATSSYQQQSAPATALRANRQNPDGADSAVAEPSIGGAAMPYNSAKIEAAKQHLVDSLNGTHIDNSADHTTSNNKSVTSTIASGAASVATGAAAAGAAALTAAKKLVSHDDETQPGAGGSHPGQVAHMPSYAKVNLKS